MTWHVAAGYLGGWAVLLVLFRCWYVWRHKKTGKVEDWFPSHPEREKYESLVRAYDDKGDDEASVKPLQIALMHRAMTNIRRAWELQEERRSMSKLMQMGAINETLWDKLQRAEHDLQIEIYDVEAEAESYIEGWGKEIMDQATRYVVTQNHRERLAEQEAAATEAAAAEIAHANSSSSGSISSMEEKKADKAQSTSSSAHGKSKETLLKEQAAAAERAAKALIAEEEREKASKKKGTMQNNTRRRNNSKSKKK